MTDQKNDTGPEYHGRSRVTPGGLLKQTFYLPPEHYEALRYQAFHRHQTISQLIRRAIDQYLDSL